MKACFVDTNVLLYAVGGASPHRAECRALVEGASTGSVQLHGSVELVQEFLFHRLRRTERAAAIAQARDVARLCTLHPFDGAVVERMLTLVSAGTLGGRDAVHAATALEAGFERIVTLDSDLAACDGLRAVTPAEALR